MKSYNSTILYDDPHVLYDGQSATATLADRSGARRKRPLPLPPLVIPPPTPQSLEAERQRRESKQAHDNIWAKAFAPQPLSEAVIPVRPVHFSPRMAEELFGSVNPEAEDELILFREELGLDAEVLL